MLLGDGHQGSSEPAVVVCPHLDVEHRRGVNFVWAASLELGWKRLMQLAGGPIELEGLEEAEPAAKLVRALNQSPIAEGMLREDACVAWAGAATEHAVDGLRRDLRRLFGEGRSADLPGSLSANRISVLGGLSMHPRFATPLAQYPETGRFLGHHGRPFGLWWSESDPAELWSARSSQVVIHFPRYTDEEAEGLSPEEDDARCNECVIEILPADPEVSIIHAMLSRGATLRDTIDRALTRITTDDAHPNARFTTEERLWIPAIQLVCDATFSELAGRRIRSSSLKDAILGELGLSIHFRLEGDETIPPTSPPTFGLMRPIRSYDYDMPSLLMVVTRRARVPLFALWVDKPRWQSDAP
jgi:hypothetical protein